MAYNVVIAADFGASNTGLTVHGKLFGVNGAQVGSTVTSGFVEAVSGLYVYVLAAPDSQEGVFVVYDSANTALRRVAVIAPRETENADVLTSSRGTSTLTTSDIDARLAAYDAPTKAELDSAQGTIIDAIPTPPEIDTQLSGTHGAGSWTTATGFSTPTNVSDAQAAIVNAIPTPTEIDTELSGIHGAGSWATAQEVLDAIEALGTSSSITVLSVIDGDDISVYRNDTWSFSATVPFALTAYEAVAFVVKRDTSIADADASLYVRSDTGLQAIDSAVAVDSSKGSLTVDSATEFSVSIDMSVTDVTPNRYTWWLKVFDISASPDEGYTRATGKFSVKDYGLRAIV